MPNTVYVAVKSLPEVLQTPLRVLGYKKADISVQSAEKFSPFSGGNQGRRSFCVLVNLATGDYKVESGSWGGSNMFSPNNLVDNCTDDSALPPNFAVIKGSEGEIVYANIYVNPASFAPLLPPAATGISDTDKRILACYRSLKSGHYRQEALINVFNPHDRFTSAFYAATHNKELAEKLAAAIDSLVARKLLKRSSNGATQITTEGKNAIADFRPNL